MSIILITNKQYSKAIISNVSSINKNEKKKKIKESIEKQCKESDRLNLH